MKIEQHLILNETKEDDGNKAVKTDQLKNLRTPFCLILIKIYKFELNLKLKWWIIFDPLFDSLSFEIYIYIGIYWRFTVL